METRTSRSIKATPLGLKRLEEKRRMSGKTAEVIGGLAGVSRSLAQKFFKGQPISVENFQSLCTILEVNWEEIAESEEIVVSARNRKRMAFVISGSFKDLDPTKLAKLQAMVRTLQQLAEDTTIETVDIEEGSIRLILEGSDEGVGRLKQLFDKGELANVLGMSVMAVEPIESDVLNLGEIGEDCLKTLLVSMIRSQGASGADLSGADLSGADLSGADLSGVNFDDAIFSAETMASWELFSGQSVYSGESIREITGEQSWLFNSTLDEDFLPLSVDSWLLKRYGIDTDSIQVVRISENLMQLENDEPNIFAMPSWRQTKWFSIFTFLTSLVLGALLLLSIYSMCS